MGPIFSVTNMRPSGRKATRQGNSKVAVGVMVKARLASGFCSPALTCAQTAADAKVNSNAAFATFIELSPCFIISASKYIVPCRHRRRYADSQSAQPGVGHH